MLINHSETYFYLDSGGAVLEGGIVAPPNAATVLLAPGGKMDDSVADQYGIRAKLVPSSSLKFLDADGEEFVHVEGRAISKRLLQPGASREFPGNHGNARIVAKETGAGTGSSTGKPDPKVEAKAVLGPPENKSGSLTNPPAGKPEDKKN